MRNLMKLAFAALDGFSCAYLWQRQHTLKIKVTIDVSSGGRSWLDEEGVVYHANAWRTAVAEHLQASTSSSGIATAALCVLRSRNLWPFRASAGWLFA